MGQAKLAWTCVAAVSLVAAAVTTAGNLLLTGELTGDFPCAVVCAALLTASSAFTFTAVPTTAVYDRQ